jgi:hypothetical protein
MLIATCANGCFPFKILQVLFSPPQMNNHVAYGKFGMPFHFHTSNLLALKCAFSRIIQSRSERITEHMSQFPEVDYFVRTHLEPDLITNG